MATKDNVKTVLGITDTLQDAVIDILIRNVEARLTVWFKQHTAETKIPTELRFIVEEMVIDRFNRLGSEGMKSEAVEGHSVTFKEDDFAPYAEILRSYIPVETNAGKVRFY